LKKASVFLVFLLVASVLAASSPQPYLAQAWWDDGHMIITTKAIEFLPTGWRQLFSSYGSTLNQTTLYPDTVYRSLLADEDPRHFIDLEVWTPTNPETGTLHLAVEEFTTDLANAIKAGDWNSAILYAGRVAHYVEDIHQPYHATVNYNPHGQHSVLDASLAKYYSQMTIVTPAQAGVIQPVSNLTDFIFSIARQSSSFLPVINATLIDQGKVWSDELTAIIQNRTNSAIVDLARVWVTAITRAGVSAPSLPGSNLLSIAITGGMPSNGTLDPSKDADLALFVNDTLGVGALGTITAKLGSSQVIAGAIDLDPSPMGKFAVHIPRTTLQQFAGQSAVLSISVNSPGYSQVDKSVTLSVSGQSSAPPPQPSGDDTMYLLIIAVAVVALLIGGALVMRSRRKS
jgi:hypothetical protein